MIILKKEKSCPNKDNNFLNVWKSCCGTQNLYLTCASNNNSKKLHTSSNSNSLILALSFSMDTWMGRSYLSLEGTSPPATRSMAGCSQRRLWTQRDMGTLQKGSSPFSVYMKAPSTVQDEDESAFYICW